MRLRRIFFICFFLVGSPVVWGQITFQNFGKITPPAPISHIAVSPDGRRLAMAGPDNLASLWRIGPEQESAALEGHAALVLRVAFSPDGARLASGDSSGLVRLWHAETGESLGSLHGHKGPVTALVFSFDGVSLVSAGADGKIIFWDVGQRSPFRTLTKASAMKTLEFNRMGHYLWGIDQAGQLFFFDAMNAVELQTPKTQCDRAFLGRYPMGLNFYFHKGREQHYWSVGWRGLELMGPQRSRCKPGSIAIVEPIRNMLFDVDGRGIDLYEEPDSDGPFERVEVGLRSVTSVAMSANSDVLAISGLDDSGRCQIRLWQILPRLEVLPVGNDDYRLQLIDEDTLVSMGRTSVSWWDVKTRNCLATVPAAGEHGCMSHDGRRLVVGAKGTFDVWDLRARQPLMRIYTEGRPERLTLSEGKFSSPVADEEAGVSAATHRRFDPKTIAVSPDGQTLAIWRFDGTIQLRGTDSGELEATLEEWKGADSYSFGLDSPCYQLCFSPNGMRLAASRYTSSRGQAIGIWEVGKEGRFVEGSGVARNTELVRRRIAWANDQELLIVAGAGLGDSARQAILVYDADTCRETRRFIEIDDISQMVVSPKECLIAVRSSRVAEIGLWSLRDGSRLATYRMPGYYDYHGSASISPDGRWLAAATLGASVVYRLPNVRMESLIEPLFEVAAHEEPISSLAFVPGEERFLSAGEEGQVFHWNPSENSPGQQVRSTAHAWSTMAISRNGTSVVTGGSRFDRAFVESWDLENSEKRQSWVVGGVSVLSTSISPDGEILAYGTDSGELGIIRKRDGSVKLFEGQSQMVWATAFSLDGAMLVSAGSRGEGGDVSLWSLPDGRSLGWLTPHPVAVYTAAVSSKTGQLATGGDDRTIRIWDLSRRRLDRQFDAKTNVITRLTFSPDGKYLAVAGSEPRIRLWDTSNWECRADWLAHRDRVQSLAFSDDGKLLASAGVDRTIRLWSVKEVVSDQVRK